MTDPRDSVVEAWSTVRLPFEPKGASLDLRTALRASLRALPGTAGRGYRLSATQTSEVRSLVDTENVLLYNVGNSAVSRPAAILVERRYGPVKRPPEHAPSFEFLRHYSYNVGDAAQECYRSTERSAAVWDGQSPPARAGSLTLLQSVWTSAVLPTTLVQPSLTGNPSPSL